MLRFLTFQGRLPNTKRDRDEAPANDKIAVTRVESPIGATKV